MFRNLNTGAINVKATFEEACQLAQANGFQGIDVSAGDVERLGVEKVRDLLAQHGLKVGAYSFPNKWTGTEDEWKETLRKAPRYLELGRQIGADLTLSGLWPSSDTLTFRQNFDFHVSRFKPAALLMEDYGFRLAFEFLGPYMFRKGRKFEFIFDLQGCLEFCNAVRDSNCTVLFDVWHWYTAGGAIEEVEALSARKVAYIHVNDAPAGIPVEEQNDHVRCLPDTTGVIDVVKILELLKANGCTAPVTVEPFNEEVNRMAPADAVRTAAESLDRIFKKAGV